MLTLSDLLVAVRGYTNTSPRTKKKIIQPVGKYCATVGYDVVTWNEDNCLSTKRKSQLDATYTDIYSQLVKSQHVSGIMAIVMRTRLYKTACGVSLQHREKET